MNGWEGLWRVQRELSVEAQAAARSYRRWAWFWFLLWAATAADLAAR